MEKHNRRPRTLMGIVLSSALNFMCVHHPEGTAVLYKDNPDYAHQLIYNNLPACTADPKLFTCHWRGTVATMTSPYTSTEHTIGSDFSVPWNKIVGFTHDSWTGYIKITVDDRTKYTTHNFSGSGNLGEVMNALEGLRIKYSTQNAR